MYRKSKKLLAWSLVVCMIVTQMLFSSVALAADKASLATDRFAGADRYATAIEVSKAGWTTSEYAVLAYGEGFADALAAAPLAKKLGAPILLTGKDALSEGVLAELNRLGVNEVYIVGGEGVVAKAVEDAILAAGMDTTRLWGTDRYMTALAVAKEMGTPDTVFLAYGENYADALSVSAIAAANGWPVLLTGTDAIDADVKAYIGSKKVYVVGGTGVVSDAVLNQFDGAVRLGGVDRYDTNLKVLEHFAADLNFLNVFMATGEGFADALAGSVLAANYGSPLVLVANSVAPATLTFLAGKVTSETGVFAFGGSAVVPDSALAAVAPVVPDVLKVESVTAVNLNQLVVKFTQPVDEDSAETAVNYSLGGADLGGNDKFELASDKKTLTINLDTAKAQYDKAIFKVKGNVITGDNASVITVPVFTQELTFSDVAVPTMTAVKVTGNKKLTVTLSETVLIDANNTAGVNYGVINGAGTKFKIDGQYLTNYGFSKGTAKNMTNTKYTNKIDLEFATALPAGDHTLTLLAGDASNFRDAANFKAVEQTLNFTVASVTNAPTVVSVEGQNNGTIYVTYDRAMGNSALDRTNYKMNGNGPLPNDGIFKTGSGDTVVKFTGLTGVTAVAKGANVLTIVKDTVQDSYGNKLDKDNDVRVSFSAADDTTKPTVVSVVALSNTKVRVKFSEVVKNAYAINLANYTLKDNTGATVTLSVNPSPVGTPPTDTYDITTPALTGSNYTLKIKNIVDEAATPNKMDEYVATFNGNDDEAPGVSEAVKVGDHKVAVIFDEAMDPATITNLANYYYIDSATPAKTRALPSGTTAVAGADNKSVQFTFPSAYFIKGGGGSAEYNVMNLVIGNVKDVAGNVLKNFSYTTSSIKGVGGGTAKPDYVAKTFVLTATTGKVTAEFEMNQDITDLRITDFQVEGKAPNSGYISGKKIILEFTDTTAVTGNIAVIKAAGTGATLSCVAQTSTNIYGTPINGFANVDVYDDKIAPQFVSAVADSTLKKVIVTFSEAVDQSILGLYKDDFTVESGGEVIEITDVVTVTPADAKKFALVLKTPLVTSAVVKVAATVDIKDLANDGAETANAYVPSTDDMNGVKGNIASTDVKNAALAIIDAYATAGNAAAMTIAELTAAGVTELVAANLPAYKTSVAAAGAGGADTTVKIQALIDQDNVDAVAAAIPATFAATGAVGDVRMPAVPAGYTIAVKSSDTLGVYAADGKLVADGNSTVVYTVTHTASTLTADTGNVTVTVDVP